MGSQSWTPYALLSNLQQLKHTDSYCSDLDQHFLYPANAKQVVHIADEQILLTKICKLHED
jgi:hypothetical protein